MFNTEYVSSNSMDSKKSASETTRLEHFPLFPQISGYLARTKHLQLRKWFCTELVESGRISVHHVPTDILPADIFTKTTTKAVHRPADIFTKTTTKAVHRKLVDLIHACAS